jgi:hypothetical protein
LRDFDLDDVFSDLVRDECGRATIIVNGRSQRLDIVLGPNYRAVVIYAPKPPSVSQKPGGPTGAGAPRNFVCVEPVRYGHRVTKTGLLSNVSYRTAGALLWNDDNDRFVDDKDANRYLSRRFRNEYKL